MTFIHEIRKQPEWLRLVIFALGTVTMSALIVTAWFDSFERDLFAMMHPGESFEEKFLAKTDTTPPVTPLSLLGKGMGVLRAGIYSVLNIETQEPQTEAKIEDPAVQVHELPLSGDR